MRNAQNVNFFVTIKIRAEFSGFFFKMKPNLVKMPCLYIRWQQKESSKPDQKIVGNSLEPIGVIITGNLSIEAPC